MKNIGILGSGAVGDVLAGGFLKYGHSVMRGSREPAKLAAWKSQAGPKALVGTFEEAARFADIAVLAVKGTAASSAVELCNGALDGKVVLDTTNPIAAAAPVNGVLSFFTDLGHSLMEQLQKQAPAVRFVKAFSSAGSVVMVNPDYGGIRPSMFICGNDGAAKEEARQILDQFGWETEDMGAVEAARAIEPLCILWCIPGLVSNQWSHAFKLLKANRPG
jgi:predicted dinucleotide-binding enzyme